MTQRSIGSVARTSWILTCLLLCGCPQPAPVPPHLSAIQQRIFAPNCTFSSCHSTFGHAGNLNLEAGKAFKALVGVSPDNAAAAAEGYLRVAPGDAAHSFLLLKLRDPVPRQYGDRMPQHETPVDDADLASLKEWIALGALDD